MTNVTSNAQPRPTQAERRSASDRRLIAAGLKLIAERGADRTSLAEVATEAGYSRGLPGERFGSKLRFLEAIVDNMDRWFRTRIEPSLAGKTGLTAVLALANAHFEAAQKTPHATQALEQLYMDAVGALPELKPRMVEFRRGSITRLQNALTAGQEAGEIRGDLNARAEATMMVATIGGLIQQGFFDSDQEHVRTLQEQYLALLERHLKP